MMQWFYANGGTIVLTILLIVLVVLIIRKLISDKRQGKSSCGGNCGHCPMGGSCHQK